MINLLNKKSLLKYLDPIMFIGVLAFVILLILEELKPYKKTIVAFLIALCGLTLAVIYVL